MCCFTDNGKFPLLSFRFVLQELKSPYIYTSCAEFSKPRQLLQSVLTQLKVRRPYRRCAAEALGCGKRMIGVGQETEKS